MIHLKCVKYVVLYITYIIVKHSKSFTVQYNSVYQVQYNCRYSTVQWYFVYS